MLTLPLLSSLSPSVWQPVVYKTNWSFIVDHVILVPSHHQMPPLHWAADGGQVHTVKYLIDKGAEVNSKDGAGVSE